MENKKYQVVVIGGAGSWGQHYVNAYANHPECELVGLVDSAIERREPLAHHYGIDAEYDCVEDLLNDAVPDIVSVIVPTAYSSQIVLQCMEAGVKAVSCEKPMAMSLHEADALVETSERKGVVLGVGSLMGNNQIWRIREWIADGNLGDIEAVGIYDGSTANVSGAGCQKLATFQILTGFEPIWAEGRELERRYEGYLERDRPEEIDGPVCGKIGFANGLVCEISDPKETDLSDKGVWIQGTFGSVRMGKKLEILVQRGDKLEDVTQEVAGTRFQLRYSFIPIVNRLVRALRDGSEPRPSARDMRFALEVAIGMKQSAVRDGERVELPIEDREALIHPHPYQAFGGDIAGFQSLFPKYTAPSFENHLQQSYMVEPKHKEAMAYSEM